MSAGPGETGGQHLEREKALFAHLNEFLKVTSVLERIAIQPLLLLNGGALVAVLAFLGAIWKGPHSPSSMGLLWWAIGIWGAGLTAGAVTAALAYRSQLAFYHYGFTTFRVVTSKRYRQDGNG